LIWLLTLYLKDLSWPGSPLTFKTGNQVLRQSDKCKLSKFTFTLHEVFKPTTTVLRAVQDRTLCYSLIVT